MTEFKIGDTVLTKATSYPKRLTGIKGTIIDSDIGYDWIVRLDNESEVAYDSKELELVTEEPKGIMDIIPPEFQGVVIHSKDENGLIDKQEHYTNNDIQPIEIMKQNMTTEEYRGFLLGNIIKYPLRYKDKNGLEDLKKALTYLTWLIDDVEERGL